MRKVDVSGMSMEQFNNELQKILEENKIKKKNKQTYEQYLRSQIKFYQKELKLELSGKNKLDKRGAE